MTGSTGKWVRTHCLQNHAVNRLLSSGFEASIMQLYSVNLIGLGAWSGTQPLLLLTSRASAFYVKFHGPGILCNTLGQWDSPSLWSAVVLFPVTFLARQACLKIPWCQRPLHRQWCSFVWLLPSRLLCSSLEIHSALLADPLKPGKYLIINIH